MEVSYPFEKPKLLVKIKLDFASEKEHPFELVILLLEKSFLFHFL